MFPSRIMSAFVIAAAVRGAAAQNFLEQRSWVAEGTEGGVNSSSNISTQAFEDVFLTGSVFDSGKVYLLEHVSAPRPYIKAGSALKSGKNPFEASTQWRIQRISSTDAYAFESVHARGQFISISNSQLVLQSDPRRVQSQWRLQQVQGQRNIYIVESVAAPGLVIGLSGTSIQLWSSASKGSAHWRIAPASTNGQCSVSDMAAVWSKGGDPFRKQGTSCFSKSHSVWRGLNYGKMRKCLQSRSRLSKPCATCYADGARYAAKNCKWKCAVRSCSNACIDCMASYAAKGIRCVGGPSPHKQCICKRIPKLPGCLVQ